MSQGAKPRRLIITIALAPAARTASSASQVSAWSGPERGSASRMSTRWTGGMRRPSTRRGSSSRGSSSQLSGRGVAVPATSTAPRVGGAFAGDGAGVVGGVALLLVGGVVLLVDDDQAEVADGGEDGRARADADARLAAAQPPPLVVALAGREGRVEDREAVAEAGAEAGDGLRREADLGDEDDRALAALQRRLDRGQVDLGLAGAGDAVEEQLRGRRRPRRRGRRRSPRPPPPARAAARDGRRPRRGPGSPGMRRTAALRVATRPRSSSRRRVWRSEPTAVASSPRGHLPRAQRLQHRPLLGAEALAAAPAPPRRPAGSPPAARSWCGRCGRRCRSRCPAAAPAAGRARASSSTRGRPRGRAGPAPASPPPPAPRSARRGAPAAARRPRRPRPRPRAAAAARTAPGRRCRRSRSAIASGRR